MSLKLHQIVDNDVRCFALPASGKKKRQASGRLSPESSATGLSPDAETVGLYRTRGKGECPYDVRVLSNGISLFITEAEYRRRKCQPFFEDLPWRERSDRKPTGGTR